MSLLNKSVLTRKTISKQVVVFGLLILGTTQNANAVNLIDPKDYDWKWKSGGEPTFPNECYGEGDFCLVDTDDNDEGKSNEGDNRLFDVWVPDGIGPFPVYVYAHGGGFTGGSKKRMSLAGPLLANDDVVYVNINYTLNGQTPEEVSISIADAVDCLNYLKEHADKYKINPEQIFVGGGSAGGVIFNDIAYKQTVPGIKGIWHWNVYEQEGQSVNLTDTKLLANVDLPVVHAHPDLYPTANDHSAKLAYEHSEANWQVGSTGIFFNALQEHESAIGYGSYDYIEQIWENGKWIKDRRFWSYTGGRIPTLAEWIYENLPTGPGSDNKLDFYDDYSSDKLFNTAYEVANGTWLIRNEGTLDSKEMRTAGRVIVKQTIGDNFTASVTVRTVSKIDNEATYQVPRLMFSYTSSESFYEAYVKSDGKVSLDKTVRGEKRNIGVFQLDNYDETIGNRLQVSKEGSTIEVYVNEQLYVRVQDNSLNGGSVGLRSFENHARFDNLRIAEW